MADGAQRPPHHARAPDRRNAGATAAQGGAIVNEIRDIGGV